MYGLGRIAQVYTSTEYFLGDALGSTRQLTDEAGEITLAKSYDPYGVVTNTSGESVTKYGYTGEATDASGMVYLRARYYNPADGRFTSRDTWSGDVNSPLSMNRWNYVEGNPINLTDPSGHSPNVSSQILSRALTQYAGASNNINILSLVNNCLLVSHAINNKQRQFDLTGYLAIAMSKHGQDSRIKNIANEITTLEKRGWLGLSPRAYSDFNKLEGKEKVWDIKINIKKRLGENIVLCGTGINCHWFDYSTPGNIHFGYVAGLAKIDHYVAAIFGGHAEQTDLQDNAEKAGDSYDWKDCFKNNFPNIDLCDNSQDQAAVDFGFELAKNPKYKNGITDEELRRELQINGMGNFQTNPHAYDEYWSQVYPEVNRYSADAFNQ